MDGLIQTNKEMKFELKRKYVVNSIKTLEAGAVIDVTQEKYEWLEKNAAKQEKLQDTIPDPQDRPQSDEPKKQSILGKMGDFITNPLGSE